MKLLHELNYDLVFFGFPGFALAFEGAEVEVSAVGGGFFEGSRN